MNKRDDLRFNGSGIKDPTAYKAIKKVDEETTRRANQLIKAIQSITHLAGFEIAGRIELRDKNTGEIFK